MDYKQTQPGELSAADRELYHLAIKGLHETRDSIGRDLAHGLIWDYGRKIGLEEHAIRELIK